MRIDHKIISGIIPNGSKVIDIGCGTGDLLEFLSKKNNIDGRGLEISQPKVSKAVAKGLSVVQGDADKDLEFYPDKSFDYAILGQTLQAMSRPKETLTEILRISNFAIVSIPNFGNIKNRLYLLTKGRMPVTENLSYEWYETPNIHFCTIDDLISLCKKMHVKIEKKIFIKRKKNGKDKVSSSTSFANLFAEEAIFVLKK